MEREAMQAINECLKRTTDETLLGDLLRDALDIAVTLEGKTQPVPGVLIVHGAGEQLKSGTQYAQCCLCNCDNIGLDVPLDCGD